MEINPSKSKFMHVGKNNPGLPYSINGQPIDSVTTEKDIGFWISDDLNPFNPCPQRQKQSIGGNKSDWKELYLH